MKTAVIYARYSSERQTEQSIEGQVREIKRHRKTLKAAHAINSCDEEIARLNGLKLTF